MKIMFLPMQGISKENKSAPVSRQKAKVLLNS